MTTQNSFNFVAAGQPMGRVTPTFIATQAEPIAGMGICDPFLRQILTGPECGMYATAFKAYELIAAAADITRATGVTEINFIAGVGDIPAAGNEGYWFAAPQSFTNNLSVASGLGWATLTGWITSMMKVEVMEPVMRYSGTAGAAGGAVTATDQQYHHPQLRPGLGYNEQLKSDFANDSAFQLNYGIVGSSGENRIGPPSFYGTSIGIRGGSLAQNGNFQDPIYGRPFQGVLVIPPRSTDNLFSMSNISGQAAAIASIAAAPTSILNSAGNVLNTGSAPGRIFLPYRVTLEGYRACMDTALWCSIPGAAAGPAVAAGVVRR